MDYTIIEVPDMNDSVSRVVLSGTAYLIRFTYNDSKDYWKFSLYDSQNVPIVLGDFKNGNAQFIFCPVDFGE